jgi:hypothetical protein
VHVVPAGAVGQPMQLDAHWQHVAHPPAVNMSSPITIVAIDRLYANVREALRIVITGYFFKPSIIRSNVAEIDSRG